MPQLRGYTALYMALLNSHFPVVDILLAAKATVLISDGAKPDEAARRAAIAGNYHQLVMKLG